MGEHHRVEQPDLRREPAGHNGRRRLEQAGREEHETHLLGRRAETPVEPVDEERLHDESACVGVEGEEGRETPHVVARAVGETDVAPVVDLDAGGHLPREDGARNGDEGEHEEPPLIRRQRRVQLPERRRASRSKRTHRACQVSDKISRRSPRVIYPRLPRPLKVTLAAALNQ